MPLSRSSRAAIRASHGAGEGLGETGFAVFGGVGEAPADTVVAVGVSRRCSLRGRWSIGVAGAGRWVDGWGTGRAADKTAAHEGMAAAVAVPCDRLEDDPPDSAGRLADGASSGVRQYRRLSPGPTAGRSPRARRGCASQTTLSAACCSSGRRRRMALSLGSCAQRSSRTKRLTSVPPTWSCRCQRTPVASCSSGMAAVTRWKAESSWSKWSRQPTDCQLETKHSTKCCCQRAW